MKLIMSRFNSDDIRRGRAYFLSRLYLSTQKFKRSAIKPKNHPNGKRGANMRVTTTVFMMSAYLSSMAIYLSSKSEFKKA